MGPSDAAEGPIQGLVLFVSATLLASATAGLLLGLGGGLVESAREAGDQGLSMARTSVEVRSVVGKILGGGARLDALNLTVGLSPGSDPVPLETLLVQLTNRTANRTLAHGTSGSTGEYTAAGLRDSDGSIAGKGLLNHDDLAALDANLSTAANDLLLGNREPLRITLLPSPGAAVELVLTTPPTYAGATVVSLR